jgi:hypothetical protein
MYGPYLTIAEINAKYPNEWVFLANPTATRYHEVTGGYVILHAADRAEYLRLVGEWDDPQIKHLASHYTGEIKGIEILPADAEPEPGVA